jgi:hypothetical protein
MLGVGHIVTTSVGMCDIDIRPVSFIDDNFHKTLNKWHQIAVSFSKTRHKSHFDISENLVKNVPVL